MLQTNYHKKKNASMGQKNFHVTEKSNKMNLKKKTQKSHKEPKYKTK